MLPEWLLSRTGQGRFSDVQGAPTASERFRISESVQRFLTDAYCTMRFESTAKVLTKRVLECYRI